MYREILRKNVVDVTFTKKDGSLRKMTCTLLPELLPQPYLDASVNSKPSEDVITVWDLEANGWRSFRADAVKSFEYDTPVPNTIATAA